MSFLTFNGPGKFSGTVMPPGDKSVSHRALLFGSLSDGESRYENFLEGEDCLRTLEALRMMGISIDHVPGSGVITVRGNGVRGLKAPAGEIYLGNSGTSIRLLLGILAGQEFETTLSGDPSLSLRPMRRVTDPLKRMGAQIKGKDNANFAPLTIRGGNLRGIDFDNRLSSAQVKSALLFAGMYADGPTVIRETIASRDHTERFLKAAGANFTREGGLLTIGRTDNLRPFRAKIPGDISSAAFFLAGAAMVPGSEILVRDVGLNPTRTGILDVLKRMGAGIEVRVTQEVPEPLGEIRVRGARLRGTGVGRSEIPSLVDELPVLMVAMSLAEGESLVSGAEELRVKETDRIRSMVRNLKAVGASIEELPDGCFIRGVEALRGGAIDSFADHRTAMSLAIASLASNAPIVVNGTDCIATSYPDFERHFYSVFKPR
ncbi:MAG: 3-phosphoshikimate 1-carboxyvinyltransferase 1 [Candidatus Omnitrophica bacterium ADurb.Bin314]|jgi:3-phosphoshikimate 1-carboxyvinyltransferase|nr:MAG: 3-phosphoshikimate 1-carboxyvinyltransferase 1 [Candidatus Omnitrophica bacterium ADurb.Bin314]